jgi:hypothetical protein
MRPAPGVARGRAAARVACAAPHILRRAAAGRARFVTRRGRRVASRTRGERAGRAAAAAGGVLDVAPSPPVLLDAAGARRRSGAGRAPADRRAAPGCA